MGRQAEFDYQHGWDDIEPHLPKDPEEHESGIRYLAADGDEDREMDIDAQSLRYAKTNVPLSHLPKTTVLGDERVTRAAQGYRSGVKMPPVVLVHTGEGLEVEDGHHRIAAARRAGMRKIPAIIADAREV